jgi:hypothetical protein
LGGPLKPAFGLSGVKLESVAHPPPDSGLSGKHISATCMPKHLKS